ncbi:MAG: hypothetical protein RIR00_50 [Pseudomonadota bacterium]|jgi:glyoxylase-like metal-dependent hydrolase (beta-lactamase superfamily II)
MVQELEFPFPTPPAGGAVQAVAPGVLWVRMPLPFALDHINLWLLADGESWVVVDTGFALDSVRHDWDHILTQLAAPISKVIVTHFHPDHLGLATWLQARHDAPLLMTTGEFLTGQAVWHEIGGHGTTPMLAQFSQHGLDDTRLAALAQRGNGYRRGVPEMPETYQRLFDRQGLNIGGKSWQVIVGYGHSPEHAALYCPELGVLISGDMLLPKISTNISVFAVTPTADVLRLYLDSLDDLTARVAADTLVLPSHGLPFRGLQPRVEALHAHHVERLGVLEENCNEPRSAAELLSTLFPRSLDTHQTMFAMGEAIAHLNHLEQAGRLSRSIDADGVIRFQRSCLTH